jgi:predicted flap endonuclease-1-like 5' DNA nuclease
VAWYVTQSLLIILATFVLGLIVGWLWWGRAWRRVPFGESDAVRAVSTRYETTVAERNAQIDRLGRELRERVPSVIDLRDAAEDGSTTGAPGPDGSEASTGFDGGSDGGSDDSPAGPDDLQRIEGIGPRIAAALTGAGLDSYRMIAVAETERLSAALREAGLSFAPSLVTWPVQARLLATGNEVALAALKAELTAGRARPHRPATSEADSDTEQASTEQASTAQADTEQASTAQADTEQAGTAQADGEDEPEEDELERVEGIGPRIATALRKAGIETYRQLAVTDAATLQAALAASGLRFTPSLPTWSRQAALLADGDEAGFLALTRTLVPDRESGRPS